MVLLVGTVLCLGGLVCEGGRKERLMSSSQQPVLPQGLNLLSFLLLCDP